MGRKSIISDSQKNEAVKSYLSGAEGMSSLCRKLQVHKSSFKKWVVRYKSDGEAGLKHSSKNNHYPVEVKANIVKEYLNGPMDGFWGIIKSEMYYLRKFHNFNELKQAVDNYISFYNTKRLKEKLNGLTPVEYRNQTLME